MDRYKESNSNESYSRSDKNKDLYNDFANSTKYTNFSDVTNANAVDLENAKKNYKTREGYHQMKAYGNVIPTPKSKKQLDDIEYLYQDRENRVYDINSVLQEARKNKEIDANSKMRKLKDDSYNAITGIDIADLEEYRKEKEQKLRYPDEEELKELIDTISSKTMMEEVSKATNTDLFSDLLATKAMDKVSSKEEESLTLSKEILDKEQLKKITEEESYETKEETIPKGADKEFYTRSMDLSDKDFEMDIDFNKKGMPLGLKVFLTLIMLVTIGVGAYLIWKNFG